MEHCATTQRIAALVGLLLLFGSVGGVRTSPAQSLSVQAQDRLSPRLRAVALGSMTPQELGPLLAPVSTVPSSGQEAREPTVRVFVRTSTPEALLNSDISAHRVAPSLVTARATPTDLRTIAQLEAVDYVESARTYAPLNDVVRGATGAHSVQSGIFGRRYTGEGVLACMIDTGIDWTHPDFRRLDDPSQSRIRALWDQTLSAQPSEQPPGSFSYGVEYTRQDMNRGLGSNSSGPVRSTDSSGHGTRVAATIAGNGAAGPDQTHRGMAPAADIVAVKTDFSGVGIADGLAYCRSVAERADLPVVANLSLGSAAGPHDGSSPLARVIDAFAGSGRSVVAAAGNSGDTPRHRSHTLSSGETDSLKIQVPQYAPRDGRGNDVAFHLDTWSTPPTRATALLTPDGRRVPLAADTATTVHTEDGTVVYEQGTSPRNERHIELLVSDLRADGLPATGTWTLLLENSASEEASLHSWLVETTTESTLPNGTRQSTLTLPGTARSALTVGGWTHRTRWQTNSGRNAVLDDGSVGALAPFSSRGPLRNGGQKPDLVAPAQWTISARAQSASVSPNRDIGNPQYSLYRGTSTASAAAAGAVALLLQEDPSLTGGRIKELLTSNAQTNESTSGRWSAQRGHGRLDVFGAMADLRRTPIATRSTAEDQTRVSSSGQTAHTLGGAGGDALSVRFSPSKSGVVDGLFIQTASGSANRLQDSLSAAIWTSANGLPDERIGTPVNIAPGVFANHTANFVSLTESGAVVEADSTYHVVLRAEERGGELDLAGDRQSTQRPSFIRTDGAWSSLSAHLGVQISTSLTLSLAAPRLSGPAPASILKASSVPTLTWETVEQAQRYQIQVSTSSRFAPSQTDTLRSPTPSLRLPDIPTSTGYHWRVRAQRLGHSGPWSNTRSFLYYPNTVEVAANRSYPSEASDSTYRLVALPGDRTQSVDQTVDGRAGSDWQAYWERGQGADDLTSFDGSQTFRFRPGNGFWLHNTSSWQVEGTAPSVPLRDDGTYAIPLHEGWNIISNPFDLDVAWETVQASNEGSVRPLWRFSNRRFHRTDTLSSARTGEAYYYLNDQEREVLRLPYPAFPESPSGAPSAKSAPPTLTLTTARAGSTTSRVHIGVHAEAEDGRDAFDRVAPPTRFAGPTLRLTSNEEDTTPSRKFLAAEYRSGTSDGHTYSLVLDAAHKDPVEIRADGLDVFEGQEVVLVDPAAGESHDLRTKSTVTIRPESDTRSLRLLVGSSDYVETKQQVALPSDLQFLPNYPNPFSEQTTLEYVLPEPVSVRLAVYDVLGRQVRVLVDERQQAGRHTVQWNGRDESGQRMASGMYLARLVVGGTTKVRKMTFVR